MTLPVPHIPPHAFICEHDFMEQLRRAINAPSRATRCWRQNAGGVTTRNRAGKVTGRFVGAVVGSADLSGIVSPSGLRLEVEVKVDHIITPEQEAFGAMVNKMGGVYLVVRYDHALSLADNVIRGVQLVDEAIARRLSKT